MRNARLLFILTLCSTFIMLFNPGCVNTNDDDIFFNMNYGNWDDVDIDIGAVTFFTRMTNSLSEKDRKLLHDIYNKYGSVSFEWADKEQDVVDVLVKGAPIEWGLSFIQENIELVDKNLIYWRLDEVWYRANFQLYTISFPYRGKVNPDAKLYLDTGSGFEEVKLENDGTFEVMLPFSIEKTVVFEKIELSNSDLSNSESGNVIRYKRINIVNNTIDEITEQEYIYERSLYSRVEEADLDNEIEVSPVDDYTPPDVAEPDINTGPTGEWFKLNNTKEPELEGFVTIKEKIDPKKQPEEKKDENVDTKVNKPDEKPIVLPNRKDPPPKMLDGPVPIHVFIVIKGLLPTDKIKAKLIDELIGYRLLRNYYDEIEEAYVLEFSVQRISDIKRIHNALSILSTRESLQMSNNSRYFCVKMTPLKYSSVLRTKITGRVLPGSDVKIFVEPGKPEQVATVDEDGNYIAEIPLPAGTSYVYGMKVFNNETSYFQVAVLTGKNTEISKKQYDQAISDITENYKKLASKSE